MAQAARGPERVFLDANVLFSAAIGSAVCRAIWDLPGLVLLTSDYCWEEAHRNLTAKGFTSGVQWLHDCGTDLQIVPTPPRSTWRAVAAHLPGNAESDRPVLAAAVACRAAALVTGNTRDFGPLIDQPVRGPPDVLTPRGFLTRGPRRAARRRRG